MSRLFAIVLVLLLSSLLATSTLFAGTRVFADQEATSGSGTSGDPWVGWQNAISSDTEVVFIKGYYEALGNASISLPSNVALIGVDGAIVQWPEERSSIKSIFDIAAGVESVDIMGLQFEAGVSVPIEGLSSGGGSEYIVIGEVDASDPVRQVRIENNRFGVARYSDAPSGGHIYLLSSIEDLTIRNNFMDAGSTNFKYRRGSDSASQVPIYKRIRFENNVIYHSQGFEDFGNVFHVLSQTYSYYGRYELLVVAGNILHNVNGAFDVSMSGVGLRVTDNTVKSDNLDTFLSDRPPVGSTIDDFIVSDNVCSGDDEAGEQPDPEDPAKVPSWCGINISDVKRGVVQGNFLKNGAVLVDVGVAGAQDVLVSSNIVVTPRSYVPQCYSGKGTNIRFHNNTCVDSPQYGFRLSGDESQYIELIGNQLHTTSSASSPPVSFAYFVDPMDDVVMRDNRVTGDDLSGSWRSGVTPSGLRESGNIQSTSDVGFRIGGDDIADVAGDGLQVQSGTLSVESAVTRDVEWDSAQEINAATTDDDFVTLTEAAAFVTLTGSETLENKDLTATTNLLPIGAIIGFSGQGNSSSNRYFGPSVGTSSATESEVSLRVPEITAKTMECKAIPKPSLSQKWTLTLRDDGGDTSLECEITSSSSSCLTTSSAAVADGSQLALRASPTNAPTTATILCAVGVGP